jgi:Na+/H+ antiporter NhaD/arsenite permease-like protein
VAVAGCVALVLIMLLRYRRQFSRPFSRQPQLAESFSEVDPYRARWVGLILVPVIIAFFLSSPLGLDVSLIALVTGAVVLLLSKVRPSEVIRGVNWVLLLFFVGLFVVIGGAREAGVLDVVLDRITLTSDAQGIVSLHLASALVSQLVSNVPLTMLIIPLIEGVPGEVLWISLAAGATLAGNATLIGSVANLIVAEGAAREGVTVSFGEFLKAGLLVTAVTLALSIGILSLEWRLGLLT